MERLRLTLSLFALVAAACLASSCGAHQNSMQSQDPLQDPLQSIALAPAVADAQDYPNGEVPFVATGYYTNPPRTVTPLSAFWGTCYENGSTTEISVTSAGVAKCAPGAVGTFTVWADDPPNPSVVCLAITACGGGCFIAGTAQLTCP